jgi:pyruvate/2-oxoglutarate dehydrogenase complex dihydrolipoamide acyltransferase (E2) component
MSNVIFDPERWESVEAGHEALIERWLVTEGDYVHAGQALAQAMLVHENVAVEAPHDGVLEQIVVAAGEHFGRGDVLARLIDV